MQVEETQSNCVQHIICARDVASMLQHIISFDSSTTGAISAPNFTEKQDTDGLRGYLESTSQSESWGLFLHLTAPESEARALSPGLVISPKPLKQKTEFHSCSEEFPDPDAVPSFTDLVWPGLVHRTHLLLDTPGKKQGHLL